MSSTKMSLCRLFSVNLYMPGYLPSFKIDHHPWFHFSNSCHLYSISFSFFLDVIGMCNSARGYSYSYFNILPSHLFYFYLNFITSPLICNLISEFVEFATLLLKLLLSSSFVVYDFLPQQTTSSDPITNYLIHPNQ